jgi:hypothetical protein
MLNTRLYVITNIALIVGKRCRRYDMTDNEKEMVATIKLSLLRAIVDLNEETLLNLVKKVLEESKVKVCRGCRYDDGEAHAECVLCDKAESEE